METLSKTEQTYIIPTFDGMKLLILNLILLIIGLVYANNYVLLFNFILFCLFLGSMYYTHFNLQGLILVSAKLTPVHVNEVGVLTLHFKTHSRFGHHFLKLRINNKLVQILDQDFNFSFSENLGGILKVEIPTKGTRRGVEVFNRICIETLFPFHLFRSFSYFKSSLEILVFPEKKDLNIHTTLENLEDKLYEGDDFILNNFQLGDSLKRVHWKKLAQTSRWYTKKALTPDDSPVTLQSGPESIEKFGLENQLSSLTFAIIYHQYQNTKYGLSIGNIFLPPNHGSQHLLKCLTLLANYEN